jgi:CxxC motif-containing protein
MVKRLPVITSDDVAKDKVKDIVKYLDSIEVSAPIKVKDVIVSNVMGLGVDIVATRTIEE